MFRNAESVCSVDTFWAGFVVVFQVLTGENWNELLYIGLTALNGSFLVVLYFVSLNVIGIYIVLNLFLAILLARFDAKDDDDDELDGSDSSKTVPIRGKVSAAVAPVCEGTAGFPQPAAEESSKTSSEDPVVAQEEVFNVVEVNEKVRSLLVFQSDHPLRKMCISLLRSPRFENVVLLLIFLSTVCLVLDEPWITSCEVSVFLVQFFLKYNLGE